MREIPGFVYDEQTQRYYPQGKVKKREVEKGIPSYPAEILWRNGIWCTADTPLSAVHRVQMGEIHRPLRMGDPTKGAYVSDDFTLWLDDMILETRDARLELELPQSTLEKFTVHNGELIALQRSEGIVSWRADGSMSSIVMPCHDYIIWQNAIVTAIDDAVCFKGATINLKGTVSAMCATEAYLWIACLGGHLYRYDRNFKRRSPLKVGYTFKRLWSHSAGLIAMDFAENLYSLDDDGNVIRTLPRPDFCLKPWMLVEVMEERVVMGNVGSDFVVSWSLPDLGLEARWQLPGPLQQLCLKAQQIVPITDVS